MDSRARGVFACTVLFLNGRQITLRAKGTWKVWELKKHIRKRLGIPDYEQVLIYEDVQLCSNDSLCDIGPLDEEQTLTLSLVRGERQDCFSRSEVSELWQFFLALSPDSGDTIDGADVSRVVRFADICREPEIITSGISITDRVTFLDVLALLESVRVPVEPRTNRRPNRSYDRTDFGGRLPKRMVATGEQVGNANDESDETDESGETDDSDESESCQESG
eukprot:TRINITY_DN59239_c0_g1_i1.p1 TRINITY_DN59239_c0_g1~~TRINITY_DN59239_c0_g1_i1.p1  ORF type:complete len:221 (+),score=14.87 TRINITY_DN59239_c0_g1_i1:46-708(+)